MLRLTCKIIAIDEFGAAVPEITTREFLSKGFDFGDVLSLEFSSGCILQDVPFYNGFYVPIGKPILVAYPGYKYPAINYNCLDFHEQTGVRAGDSVTITVQVKGGRKDVMDLRGVVYSNDPADYASLQQFSNAREFRVGKIAPGKLYRCASPFDHLMKRPEAVNEFLRDRGVRTVFALSESETTLSERRDAMPDYGRMLYEGGHVIPVGLGAGYFSEEFSHKLVNGLVRACGEPFPWAIHCLEGKDRTGFVCILLGSLMDAGYEELLSDFMKTFENYYGITPESDPVRYQGFKSTFIDTYLRRFAGLDETEDPKGHSYRKGAEDYLRFGGMSEAQIETLKQRLMGL